LGAIVERATRDSKEWEDILSNAFTIAANGMNIPQLLDPRDVAGVSSPDEKIIMIYVSEFYEVMSKKQRLEEAEAWRHKQVVFDQFTQLADKINVQLDLFSQSKLDLPTYDSPRDPELLEKLEGLQKARSSSILEYEPTIQTLSKTGNTLVNSYQDSEPAFIAIVKDIQDKVIQKWDDLIKSIEEESELIQNLSAWGELNELLTLFGAKLDSIHSNITELTDKRGTLPPEEAEAQFSQLSDVLKDHLKEWSELNQRAESKAPAHITEKLKRYKEFLDQSKGNLDRFKALEQFQKFKDHLSDQLLTLFNKRSEIRKLIMKTMWTPEVTDYSDVEEKLSSLKIWLENDGEKLIENVKAKCVDIRKLIEESNLSNQNSQLSTILLKEEEVMVSWQELTRLTNIGHQLLNQTKMVTKINSSLDQIDQILNEVEVIILEGSGDQSATQETLSKALEDLQILETEKESIPTVDSPEAQSATQEILNYLTQRFQHLYSQIDNLKSQKQQIEENSELLRLFEESITNGADLIETLNNQTQWVERALELLATMESSQVQEITTQLSSKLEELSTEITLIETKHKKFVNSVDEVYSKLQLNSHKSELDRLKKEAVVLFKNLETGASSIIQGVLSGDYISSNVSQIGELLSAMKDLEVAISGSDLDALDKSAFDEWRTAIEEVDSKCDDLTSSPPKDFNPQLIPKLKSQFDKKIQALRDISKSSSELLNERYNTFSNKDFKKHLESCEIFTKECEELKDNTKLAIEANGHILGLLFEDDLVKYQEFKVAHQEVLLSRSHIKPKYKALVSDYEKLKGLPEADLTGKSFEAHNKSVELFQSCESALEASKALIDFNAVIIETLGEITKISESLQDDQQSIIDLIHTPSDELNQKLDEIDKLLQSKQEKLQKIKIPNDYHDSFKDFDASVLEIANHNVSKLGNQLMKLLDSFEGLSKQFQVNKKTAEDLQSSQIEEKVAGLETWCQQQFETLVQERGQIKELALSQESSVASINTLLSKMENNHDKLKDKIKSQSSEVDKLEAQLRASSNTDKSPRIKAMLTDLEQEMSDRVDVADHIKNLTKHSENCKLLDTKINSLRSPIQKDILDSKALEILELSITPPQGDLLILKFEFDSSLSQVDHIFNRLDSSDSSDDLVSFVELDKVHQLQKFSQELISGYDNLDKLRELSKSNLEVSKKSSHLIELLESLQTNVDEIDSVDVSQTKKDEALDLIKSRIQDPILKEYENLRRMVLNLPNGSKDWSSKVKSIDEMSHLLLAAIEEKQSEIRNAAMVQQFLVRSDEMDNLIGQFLEVIDSVTLIADSSTSFLEELEKAQKKLQAKDDSLTSQANDLIDELSSQSQTIRDWRAGQRLQLISDQWDETSQLSKSILDKLAKRIEYKQESQEMNRAKSLQRANSRSQPKYIPPDKNKIGSRYMQNIGNAKTKASPRQRARKLSVDNKATSPNRYVPNLKDNLDVEIARVVNECPDPILVARDPETGKYWIGDKDPKLCFCRVLNSRMVMVRVGGGWKELSKYLSDYSEKHGSSSNPNTIKSPSRFFRAYNAELDFDRPPSRSSGGITGVLSPDSMRKFASPLISNRPMNVSISADGRPTYGSGSSHVPLEYKNRPKSRLGTKSGTLSMPTSRSHSEGTNNLHDQHLSLSNRSSVLMSPTGSNGSRPSSRMYSRPGSSLSGNYASPTIASASKAFKNSGEDLLKPNYHTLERGINLQKSRSSSSLNDGKSSTRSLPPNQKPVFNVMDPEAFSPINEANELSQLESSP
jgi:DNA repair exonuclease SbcCD ATPase subunit